MLSNEYKIEDFVDKIKDKDRLMMIHIIETEIQKAAKKYPINKDEKILDYHEKLNGLLYFVKNGLQPYIVDFDEFKKFKPICERLVEKGQMEENALEEF